VNESIRPLLRELRVGLEALYRERLAGVYLYGSYAREEEDGESDLDVLVVLKEFAAYGAEIDRTGPLCAALSLKHRVSISRVFARERDWRSGETPFLARVREEAVGA